MGSGSSRRSTVQTPRDRQAASLRSIEDPERFEQQKQDPKRKTVEFTVKPLQVQYGEMLCGICGYDGASDKCCLTRLQPQRRSAAHESKDESKCERGARILSDAPKLLGHSTIQIAIRTFTAHFQPPTQAPDVEGTLSSV